MTTTKAYKGLPMEGLIATWYAKTTLKDVKRHRLMAKQLAEKIPANGKVLEIAPGPGYFSIELAKLDKYEITGLDISKSFVEIARKNAEQAGLRIDFREGNASAMPFKDNTFDFTFCQAAFKNFSEPVKAIAEMYRVLRPGGQLFGADFVEPRSSFGKAIRPLTRRFERVADNLDGFLPVMFREAGFKNYMETRRYFFGSISLFQGSKS